MINTGKEWHWMDENTPIEDKLSGWGFDMDSLRESEGALFSSLDRRSPRAFSTKVSNEGDNFPTGLSPTGDLYNEIAADEWCYYAGMPSPSAYMDNS